MAKLLTAAPQLAEALRDALNYISTDQSTEPGPDYHLRTLLGRKIRAALAVAGLEVVTDA